MRKFLLLIALIVAGAGVISAQNEITIGNGTSSDYNAPFNNYYRHSWNETIYQKGDIGGAGTITSVSYQRASGSSYYTQTIKIYMGETTRSSISSSTDWTPASQLTLVYSGSNIVIGDTEWEKFVLNTPFEYSGENNLVVVVAKTASSYTNSLNWYYTNSSNGSVSMYRQDDSSTSYATHPSGNTGTRLTYAANIKLGGDFSTSEQPLTIGDSKVIDYNGYSLKYTVTSVNPAECEVEGYDVYGMPVGTAVTIPSVVKIKANDVNVKAIKDYAFYGAYGMVSIEIPTSVTSIGEGITNGGCDYLENINIIDGNSVYDDRNNCNAIIETATNRLIAGCKNTIIPDGITSIGSYAFMDLSDLKYIEIPSSVTTLEEFAFCQTGLLNIVFKDNSQLVSIERAAFANNNLISIEIPNSVKSIGYAAFESHANLTNISVEEGNTVYDSRNNCNAIIETATNTLILGGKNTVIPHGITHIERAAFQSIDLNSFTLPSSITYIGEHALPYVNELKCHAKDVPEIDGSLNLSNVCIIYVPESSIDDYQSTYPWSNYTIMPIQASAGELGYSSIINYDGYSLKYTITSTNPRECEVECHTAPTSDVTLDIPSSVNISGMDYEVTSVASGGFWGAMYFKGELRIPNTVRYIGKEAFSAICTTDLIEIPNSVTYIGEEAFWAISTASGKMITKIILSNSASYIGEDAFNGNAIEEFVIAEGTKSIGDNFGIYGNKIIIPNSVEYIGTNSISSYDLIICHAEEVPETSATSLGSPKNIQVPESSVEAYKAAEPWKNYNITKIYPYVIGDYAIVDYNGYSLKYTITSLEPAECEVVCSSFPTTPTSITIPSSVNIKGGEFAVTSTGEWAFSERDLSNNTTITSIELPNTVKSLGQISFRNCSGLQSVTFGENSQLTTISWDAFRNCTGLTSINIPNGVTTIGSVAFYGCTNLTSINIPSSVTTIDMRVFNGCTSLESIEIPNSVTIIEFESFKGCSNLSNITCLAESVPSTDIDAFNGCPSNMKIYVPKSSVSLYQASSPWNNYTIEGIHKAAIGDNVTIEYYKDHYQWYKLKYTVINLEPAECKVECEWLSMNTNRTKIDIPEIVSIEDQDYTVTVIGFMGGAWVSEVNMPSTITEIKKEAFYNSNLSSISLPEGLISIGDNAFSSSHGTLQSITIPNTVTHIGEYAFSNVKYLKTVILPKNMTTIGKGMFVRCKQLKNIEIPNGVTSIEEKAFYCSGLENVFIPKAVKTIGDYAFSIDDDAYSYLKSIVFEEGTQLESIGNYAFYDCDKLASIEIPNGVTSIGDKAFNRCTNLTNIYCYGVTPAALGSEVFKYIPSNAKIYVPSSSLNEYKTQWSEYADKIFAMSVYTEEGWDSELTTTSLVSVKGNLVIEKNEILNVASIVISDNASVIVKDGGQLACNDVTGNVIVEKEIEGYADQDGNSWHTIASPLKGKIDLSASSVSNIFNNQYDLYRYDEPTYTWQNYKNSAVNGFTNLEAGRGYLYANSEDVTLNFNGEINTEVTSYYLTKDGEGLSGFNLIGNPFTHNICINQNTQSDEVSTYTLVFKLYDDEDDGWNGCKLKVSFSDGSESEFYTISDGSSATYNLVIKSNDNITVSWVEGNWAEECSFVIKYEDGTEICKKTGSELSKLSTGDVLYTLLQASDVELAQGYYALSNEGAWGVQLGFDEPVKPCQGVLVKALEEGILVIKNEMPQASRSQQGNKSTRQQALQINVANGKYSDKAFVVFDKGIGLDKINHENENIPLLYIPVDGTDYAIAMMDMNVNEIPVNFETNVMGEYTISLRQENCEFEELYLLDKETNTTVNILAEDYTFIATSSDNPERFVLLKKANGQQTTDNSHFAYVNNGDIVIYDIEGNGDIQIFDAMGRCVYNGNCCTDAIHRVPMVGFSTGVYMIQKADESGVKVQKIIL